LISLCAMAYGLQPGPWSVLLCSVLLCTELISRIEIGLPSRLCLGMQGCRLAVEV